MISLVVGFHGHRVSTLILLDHLIEVLKHPEVSSRKNEHFNVLAVLDVLFESSMSIDVVDTRISIVVCEAAVQ